MPILTNKRKEMQEENRLIIPGDKEGRNMQSKIEQISLKCKGGFPNDAYTFNDGLLNVQVDKNGGINELVSNSKSMREDNDMFWFKPGEREGILSKERALSNREYNMYGPAIRFISTIRNGRNLYHVPDDIDIMPFGFRSKSERFGISTEYNMCISDPAIIFSFKNLSKDRDKLKLMLAMPSLVSGEFVGKKGILPSCFFGKDIALERARKNEPEYIDKYTVSWNQPEFDKDKNCFYILGKTQWPDGKEQPICVAISAIAPISAEDEKEDFKIVSASWEDSIEDELQFYIIVESSLEKCLAGIEYIKKSSGKIWQEQINRYYELSKSIPRVRIEGYPIASEMARTIPLFVSAAKLKENTKNAAIGTYLRGNRLFKCWDELYPARSMLLWGDYTLPQKVIHHSIQYPSTENPIFTCLMGEYYMLTKDRDFLHEHYPSIKDGFEKMISCLNKDGLLISLTMGLDHAKELQHAPVHITPDGNAWFYSATRFIENMAMVEGDTQTEQKAREIADNVEKLYIETFYDDDMGYFVVSVDAETGERNESYQNILTMAMQTPYGDILVDDQIESLAKFMKKELYHPSGRSSIPYWDKGEEMWKSCIMLQHAAHESKAMRYANESEELIRMWKVYMELFEKDSLFLETINLSGLPSDNIGQHSSWYTMSSATQYQTLLWGIIGIDLDYDGITYIPCDIDLDIKLSGLRHGKTKWDVEISGKGKWVESMGVDGQEFAGLLKTPKRYFDGGEHKLKIRRGNKPFHIPVILRAVGAGIGIVNVDNSGLDAQLEGIGRIPVRFYSPAKPASISFDGQDIPFKWNSSKMTGLVEIVLRGSGKLTLMI